MVMFVIESLIGNIGTRLIMPFLLVGGGLMMISIVYIGDYIDRKLLEGKKKKKK
jgi:hypothetical protein